MKKYKTVKIFSFIFVLFIFTLLPSISYAGWTQQSDSGSRRWQAIASNSTGDKLSAVVYQGYIYTSVDGGVTWTERTSPGSQYWKSIASSSDGVNLAATTYIYVYTSTDSGATWTQRTFANSGNIRSITSSDDGSKLAVADNMGYIWTSSDYGVNWNLQVNSGQRFWTSIASDSTGNKLAAAGSNRYIYTSTDGGVNWTERTNSGQRFWTSIASDSTGNKLAATAGVNGYIYTSTDAGATWTARTGAGARLWTSISSSDDGTKLIAAYYASGGNGYVYISEDSGASWTQQTSAGNRSWNPTAINDAGDNMFSAVGSGSYTGYIYTYDTTTTPPVLTTEEADILSSTATLNGTITDLGGENPTTRGFQYGLTTSYGTSTTETGTFSTGAYTASITGLACGGTTYHYRSYATNTSSGGGTGYGDDTTFITSACVDEPTLTTEDASSLDRTTATLNGTITATGGENPTTRGFQYGLTASYGTTTTENGSFSTGAYTASITGLACGTTYHYRSYATNTGGSGYGTDKTFATSDCPTIPTLTTQSASSVSLDTATLNGTITATGGENPTTRGFQYGLTASYGTTTTENGSFSTGAYTASITGLACGTTYHYRSYATNGGGTGYGDDTTFTTSDCTVGNWTQQNGSGSHRWQAITSDSTGNKLAAVVYQGYLYTSVDGGVTWTERTAPGSQYWKSVASSSDGVNLAAATYIYVYTSTDSGATWTQRTFANSGNIRSITSSDDGSKLAVADNMGYIWTSSDYGVNWNLQVNSGQRFWTSITSDSTGNKLAAAGSNRYIYTSTDGGVNWIERTNSGQRFWTSITSDSTGNKLAATVGVNGYIYTSTDAGVTWTARTGAGARLWTSISSSDDGTKLIAAYYASGGNGYVYISEDSGASWTQQTSAGNRSWNPTAINDVGDNMFSAVGSGSYTGYIYTYDTGIVSDTTPNSFSFTDQNGVDTNTVIESNEITVSGINASTSVSIDSCTGTNCEYSINGGAFTSTEGTVENGDTIYVHQTSSASNATTTNLVLNIGGITDTFSITTSGGNDDIPDAFSFTDQNPVDTGILYESNSITITGIDTLSNISITSCTSTNCGYSVNGTAYTSDAGTVVNGNTIKVRQISSASESTTTNLVLDIGGVTDTFSLTTGDFTPNAFSFTAQDGVSTNTEVESNEITIAGINMPVVISIISCTGTNCEYSVNEGEYTEEDGTVNNGDTIIVHQTSSESESTITNLLLDIGGVSDVFSVTTGEFFYDPPTLTTENASSITKNAATLNGTITATGGENPTVRGFQYGINIEYGNATASYGSFEAETFYESISSLACETTYHYRSYAANSAGTRYGNDQIFETNSCGGGGGGGGGNTSQPPVTPLSVIPVISPTDCLPGYLFSPTTGTACLSTNTISNTILPSTSSRTLKLNMTGDDVRELQIFLNTHGYIIAVTGNGSPGNESTYFGERTQNAVKLFQKANGLTPDGAVGPKTKEKMGI